MSGNADHGDVCPDSVTMIRFIDQVEEVGSKAYCSTSSSYANLTEHDYIGLSASPQETFSSLSAANTYSKVGEELESRDTELRLGIGPQCNGHASAESHANGVSRQQTPSASRQLIRQDDAGLDGTPYQPRGDVLVNTAMEVDRSFWPWIVSHGRFRIPVPKVSVAATKRPYMEIGGESGEDKALACALLTNSGTPLTEPAMVVPSLQGGALYTWSHNSVSASHWQHACGPTSALDAGASYATSNTFGNRSLPPSPVFKVPPTPPISQYSPQPPSKPASAAVAPHSSPSSDGRPLLTRCNGEEDARMAKAPVVGWPPVRSFRKNTLQSTGSNKAGNTSSDVQKHNDVNANAPEAVGEQNKSSNKDTLFVKAKLDGVRICRKVDLTSYNNYDSLKSALQEMFQGFICNDNAKLDLLQGKNYVLTHEDKDGDWMLVGDVPWHMFVTTVKSFRIMKAVDAVGLGEKTFAKMRAQLRT